MIAEWLGCPVCNAAGDRLSLTVDGEHVEIECSECQSRLKQWRPSGRSEVAP